MKKLIITLKYTTDGPDQDEAIVSFASMQAKALLTSAALVCGNNRVDISVENESFFHGRDKVELADDID